MQIWQMKQQEVHGLATKLLQADQVVHEQQLGWQWQGPDQEALLAGPHSPQASKGLQGSKKKSRAQAGSVAEVTDDGETTEGVLAAYRLFCVASRGGVSEESGSWVG